MSPTYRAVVLAVHGWNGSCRATFGEKEESIFRVLNRDDTHFYDFDCFEYDSRNTSISDNVRKLHERMLALHNLGYTHAMLITHSTGSVIALQMLTDALLNSDGASRNDLEDEILLANNGIHVTAVQAWATPINGLRKHIEFAGRILTLIGYSSETLPDLAPNSRFLVTLKERLKVLGDLSNDMTPDARSRIGNVSVNFYHGQGDDAVVREINPNDARNYGWLWPSGRGALIDTGTGHSHNVAESGHVGAPQFTGRTMQLEALLSLPFEPRFNEVFPSDLKVVPSSLESRQIGVIKALTFYAHHRFPAAMFPAIDFLHKMMSNPSQGARSKKVDSVLIDELLKLLERKKPSDELVRFLIGFGKKVLMYYDPSGPANLSSLGYNEADVVENMQKLVLVTLTTVTKYLTAQGIEKQRSLLVTYDYASIKDFEKDMHTVIGLFLYSRYHTVQNRTVADIRDVVEASTADVLSASPLIASTLKFARDNYLTLPQEQKTHILETISLASSKSPMLRADILGSWGSEVPHLGQQRPLWATLNNDEVIARLAIQIPNDHRLETSEWQFLADVASLGGARGNSLGLARSAEQRLLNAILEGHFEPTLRQQYIEMLMSTGQNAVYPTIGRQFLQGAKNLKALDFPRVQVE